MGITFSDIISSVEEKGDGRSFSTSWHYRWANEVRRRVALDALAGGFHGLYFLYKEATVDGGSVAGQSRYGLPDDFIDDLNVWYDGTLLVKSPPGVIDIGLGLPSNDSGLNVTPKWVTMRGREFEIRPIPTESGKEIRLFYNGLPEEIKDTSFSDYFLTHFPDLHIYGMAFKMALYMKDMASAQAFKALFEEEKQSLILQNRRHYLKNAKMRFQSWDEFKDKKRIVFPQFNYEGL
jgi:hypothetical protein